MGDVIRGVIRNKCAKQNIFNSVQATKVFKTTILKTAIFYLIASDADQLLSAVKLAEPVKPPKISLPHPVRAMIEGQVFVPALSRASKIIGT